MALYNKRIFRFQFRYPGHVFWVHITYTPDLLDHVPAVLEELGFEAVEEEEGGGFRRGQISLEIVEDDWMYDSKEYLPLKERLGIVLEEIEQDLAELGAESVEEEEKEAKASGKRKRKSKTAVAS